MLLHAGTTPVGTTSDRVLRHPPLAVAVEAQPHAHTRKQHITHPGSAPSARPPQLFFRPPSPPISAGRPMRLPTRHHTPASMRCKPHWSAAAHLPAAPSSHRRAGLHIQHASLRAAMAKHATGSRRSPAALRPALPRSRHAAKGQSRHIRHPLTHLTTPTPPSHARRTPAQSAAHRNRPHQATTAIDRATRAIDRPPLT